MLRGIFMVALLAPPISAAAAGQEPSQARIADPALERCARIQDDRSRLACYDAALREASNPSARASATQTEAPLADVQAADSFGRPDEPEPGFGLPALSLPEIGLPRIGRSDGAALADAEAEAPTAPDVRVIEVDQNGDPSKIELVVERVRVVGYNTHRFHMTNGQIWEVTDTGRVWVPRTDTVIAELRIAGMGGYFMRLNGTGRAYRVRRLD